MTARRFLGFQTLFCLILVFVSTLSTEAKAQVDGLYEIQGFNSENGPYKGEGWIYKGRIQRLIRWNSLRYRLPAQNVDYAVESVWEGSVTGGGPRFELTLSNTLTSFEGFAPSPEVLNAPVVVQPRATGLGQFVFVVPGEGTYQETWRQTGPATYAPLWINLRHRVEALGNGGPSSAVLRLAGALGINKVIQWYRSQPDTLPYRDRPEFREQKQYIIEDRTDADFYSTHPRTLRLANKTLNPLAFAEALMRRNAYAPTLLQKAELLQTQTVNDNLNSAGLLEVVNFQNGERVSRVPEYDSGLWTAMLGWAEIHRYRATHDPTALRNFNKILKGMLTLVEITGEPKEFARTLAVSAPEENLGQEWVQGTGAFAHLKWRRGGNNDMLKGVLITLALAHQVIDTNDTELIARIQKVTESMMKLKVVDDDRGNKAMANGLLALWTEDQDKIPLFLNGIFSLTSGLSDMFGIESGTYFGGIADWSGIHLTMVSSMIQAITADQLAEIFPDYERTWEIRKARRAAEDRLLEMQNVYAPAQRDFLTIMTYAYSARARQSAAYRAQVDEALWSLKETPAPRTFGSGAIALPLRADWCVSAWPRVPWKVLKGVNKLADDIAFKRLVSGVYGYPIFESSAWGSTYVWKDSPFTIGYSNPAGQQVFSSDYLLLYWAARSSGLLSPRD